MTYVRVVEGEDGCCKGVLEPVTGRRHQLRLVMKYLGCPIFGDPTYGVGGERMGLNCWIMGLEEEGGVLWIKGEEPFGIEDCCEGEGEGAKRTTGECLLK